MTKMLVDNQEPTRHPLDTGLKFTVAEDWSSATLKIIRKNLFNSSGHLLQQQNYFHTDWFTGDQTEIPASWHLTFTQSLTSCGTPYSYSSGRSKWIPAWWYSASLVACWPLLPFSIKTKNMQDSELSYLLCFDDIRECGRLGPELSLWMWKIGSRDSILISQYPRSSPPP